MSPTLQDTAARAETALVGWRLDRLRGALERPLVVVGAGGSLPVAALWAALHARSGQPAWAATPLELREGRWPQGAAVLVLSASGRHHDVLGAARHALAAGHPVHAVTNRPDAPLIDLVREGGARHQTVALAGPSFEEGLAARHAAVPMALLAGRLYARGEERVDAGLFEAPALLPLDPFGGRPGDVVALGAGLARPAAEVFAHLVRESEGWRRRGRVIRRTSRTGSSSRWGRRRGSRSSGSASRRGSGRTSGRCRLRWRRCGVDRGRGGGRGGVVRASAGRGGGGDAGGGGAAGAGEHPAVGGGAVPAAGRWVSG
ncbi:MAG: hypothetical protein R3F65_15190 [bacterium]